MLWIEGGEVEGGTNAKAVHVDLHHRSLVMGCLGIIYWEQPTLTIGQAGSENSRTLGWWHQMHAVGLQLGKLVI